MTSGWYLSPLQQGLTSPILYRGNGYIGDLALAFCIRNLRIGNDSGNGIFSCLHRRIFLYFLCIRKSITEYDISFLIEESDIFFGIYYFCLDEYGHEGHALGSAQYSDNLIVPIEYRYGYSDTKTFFQSNQTEDSGNIRCPMFAYPLYQSR